MQEPPENEECPAGSSWKFAKQSWNPLEFGSATTTSKQYNPGRVRNVPRDCQATVRNKLVAKFSRAKKTLCEPPPPCRKMVSVFSVCSSNHNIFGQSTVDSQVSPIRKGSTLDQLVGAQLK